MSTKIAPVSFSQMFPHVLGDNVISLSLALSDLDLLICICFSKFASLVSVLRR